MDFRLNYFDIHSHLNFPHFDKDREEIIEKMKESGVFTITVGTDKETSKEAVLLAEKHDNIYATVGSHPADRSDEWDEEYFNDLIKSSKKVMGIGECGLDYYRISNSNEKEASRIKNKQKNLFINQIELALRNKLPLMFHFRPKQGSMDAYLDGLEILEEYKGRVRGNSHFFVGNINVAERFLALGHTLSFDGPITFSKDYDEVLKFAPIEKIMAETDAPFASPAPHRGKRNSPLYVKEVYKKIAEIKGIEYEECRAILNENAKKFWLFS